MKYTAWRLTKARHHDTAFAGHGAMLHAGRWHRKGIPIVYAAENPALALLETMVHIEDAGLMAFEYVVIPVQFEEKHRILLDASRLPPDWNVWPWPMSTQRLGTQWYREQTSVMLQVPSAVAPQQANYLINSAHPEFVELQIGDPHPFPIDPRLAGQR